MSKHTPAPWYACQWGKQVDIGIYPSGSGLICRVAPSSDRSLGIPTPEDSANARLIAAAPDLLDACKSALEILVDSWGDERMCESDCQAANVLRRAIARAEKG